MEHKMNPFHPRVGILLRDFLRSSDKPSLQLLDALHLPEVQECGNDFDRLVLVFQHIPERAAIYLANQFLSHPDVALSHITVEPEISDLLGEPNISERQSLIGLPVAFWADGWRLAKEAALRMQRDRVHADSEVAFQKHCTIRILDVLISGLDAETPIKENGGYGSQARAKSIVNNDAHAS